MNLLITGGCGFIGSNFINYIYSTNTCNIINIDAMYYCASEDNIENTIKTSNRYTFYNMNINEYDKLCDILKKHSITHIIHFAAQSHVDNSFNDSLQYTYDNVKGTHTLLEAIKNTNLNIILLHISTDEVYGESMVDEEMKNEQSLLYPTNPYAASKAAAEMYVHSYIKSFGLKVIITRGNNVYGPNQYPEKLLPKFIHLLNDGKKCTIHGDGNMTRSFIHVYDVCTAVERILLYGSFGNIYNIGSDEENEKSVIEITKYLIKKICKTDDYDKYIEYVEDRPFNDQRYFISNSKLKSLGWEQKINFFNGLDKYIDSELNKLDYGYILMSENREYIKERYNNIRKTDKNKIVIITNCALNLSEYSNIYIESNTFNFINILIPFYFLYNKRYFNKAIIINDFYSENNIKEKNTHISILNVIKKLNSDYTHSFKNNNWVCYNYLNCKVKLDSIIAISEKYDIFNNIVNKNTNTYNTMIENVMSFLLSKF